MKRQTITRLLLPVLLACAQLPSEAATHGHGKVSLSGSILDTACAIATGDYDQSIDLGTLSVSDLVGDGYSQLVPFSVHLVNCVVNGSDSKAHHHWKDVRITFAGEADGLHGFAMQGEGRGEALHIADMTGTEAGPGEPMPATAIEPGNMVLHYRMRLASNHQPLQPGNIHTTIRYFMEYD